MPRQQRTVVAQYCKFAWVGHNALKREVDFISNPDSTPEIFTWRPYAKDGFIVVCYFE